MKTFKSNQEKTAFVQEVFTSIAPKYDLLNRIISFNQEASWRKIAIRELGLTPASHILDVACGTCKMGCEAFRQMGTIRVSSLDLNEEMITVGKTKIAAIGKLKQAEFCIGDAMELPYEDNTFDGAISGFALRNVPDVEVVLKEMIRVVKPGGRVVILEVAKPQHKLMKRIQNFYVHKIMPKVGKQFGKSESYEWLSQSWRQFMDQKELSALFEALGMEHVHYILLSGGVVAVHRGIVVN